MAALDAREATLALIAARAPDSTVCPSEAARALFAASGSTEPEGWRNAMPAVHHAVDTLVAVGLVRLSWKGMPLKARKGPYRISCSECR